MANPRQQLPISLCLWKYLTVHAIIMSFLSHLFPTSSVLEALVPVPRGKLLFQDPNMLNMMFLYLLFFKKKNEV
jgi:hypothetical protein